MSLWLGRPSTLVALPDPAPGLSATVTRRFGEHVTLGGGRVVDFAGPGRRTFRLHWDRLSDDEYAVLEAFHTGAWGPGPWLLVTDDAAWNLLTPNQAGGTDATGDPTGFDTVDDTERLTSSTARAWRGRRSLAWSLPAAVTRGLLFIDPPDGMLGLPVPDGARLAVAARGWCDRPVQLAVGAFWLDATGQPIGAQVRGDPVTLGPSWAPVTFTAPPPAEAQAAQLSLVVTPASVTAATTVFLDAFQATHTAVPPPWRPGRGVPWVSLTDLTETYPWAETRDADATLMEVG